MDTKLVKRDSTLLADPNKVTELGRTVRKAYVGVIQDRQWLRAEVKKRIAKIKKDERESKVICDKCQKYNFRPYMEDDLRAYYSEMNRVLDSLSRYDSQSDVSKLLEAIVIEAARVAYDMFLKYVPEIDRDRVIFEYMNNVKMKTEDMIRRSTL